MYRRKIHLYSCTKASVSIFVNLLVFLCLMLVYNISYGQNGFTINESLMTGTVNGITLGGSAHLTAGNRDDDGAGWLRLTNPNQNDVGYAIINNSFNPDQGLVFDFEFAIWGGNGADGFSIFLYDANYSLERDIQDPLRFNIGALGGSLGYANNSASPGLTGGYIGFGIDAFGNYANSEEGKIGGISNTLNPNRIGIRGAGNSAFGNPYRWLGGSDNLSAVFGNNFTLDYKGNTNVRPSKQQHYRRVQLRILPVQVNGQTNYQVSVHLKVDENSPFVPVVPPFIIQDPPPAQLKVGFAGVTGGQTNIHEVRNLVVTTLGGIRVHKTVNKQRARLGEQLVYEIKLINESSYEANNLIFNDLLPPEFNVSSITFDNGGDANNVIVSGWQTGQLDMNNVIVNLNSAPYGEVKFTVTGIIDDYPSDYTLDNTANFVLTPTSNIVDDDLSNNTSTVATSIIPATIIATNEAFDFDKFTGGNVFTNDLYNDSPIELKRINLSVRVQANPVANSSLVPYLDITNGNIVVPEGTPRGNYRITYRITDVKLATNFSEATLDLFIVPDVFNLLPDAYNINWVDGGITGSVLNNDKINNKEFSFDWSSFQWLSNPPAGVTLNNDGSISVASMTTKGQYNLRYRIGDKVYLDNFQENVAVLNVMPNLLKAVDDYVVVRYNRKPMLASNVLVNDLFNNVKISANQVQIAFVSSTVQGVEINENGDLVLNDDAQFGLYDLKYSICDNYDNGDCSVGNIRLKILPRADYIPNVITPNGDGLNDAFFIPIGVDAEKMELVIVDRIGNVRYENNNYQNDWSPAEEEIDEGTYLYVLRVFFKPDVSEVYKGHLLIVRDPMNK